MKIEHEFTWTVVSEQATKIGEIDVGTLQHHVLPRVTVEGTRFTGVNVTAGDDWFVFLRDGHGLIDVRVPIRTTDGHVVGVRYEGFVEPTPKLMTAIEQSTPTEFEDKIHTRWHLSGSGPYAFLSRLVLVGEGRLLPGGPGLLGMQHRVYRVA